MNWLLLTIQEFVLGAPLWQIFWASTLSFTSLYFAFAGLAFLLSKVIFPKWGIGRVVNKQGLFKGQIKWELSHSLLSLLIFGFYGYLTACLIRVHVLEVDWHSPFRLKFLVDLALITAWNGLHFYVIHRSLHISWLYKKVHWVHHRSKVCTPFSTFCFHWFEAFALASVMVTIMFFHTFNFWSLLVFPAVSLASNTIGHWNYSILPNRSYNNFASATKRHAGHHHFTHGNFGFLLPYMDRVLKTTLGPKQEELP